MTTGFAPWKALVACAEGFTAARVVRALSPALPQRLVRSGEDVAVLNEFGRPIGVIYSPGRTPRLGRNQATCFLRRDC